MKSQNISLIDIMIISLMGEGDEEPGIAVPGGGGVRRPFSADEHGLSLLAKDR